MFFNDIIAYISSFTIQQCTSFVLSKLPCAGFPNTEVGCYWKKFRKFCIVPILTTSYSIYCDMPCFLPVFFIISSSAVVVFQELFYSSTLVIKEYKCLSLIGICYPFLNLCANHIYNFISHISIIKAWIRFSIAANLLTDPHNF